MRLNSGTAMPPAELVLLVEMTSVLGALGGKSVDHQSNCITTDSEGNMNECSKLHSCPHI